MIMRLILLPLCGVILLILLSNQLHAADITSDINAPHKNLIDRLITRAEQHIAQAQYEQALELLYKAYDNSEKHQDNESLNNVLNSIATVYYNTGQLEQAYRYYTELVEFDRRHQDLAALSTSLYNLGHVNASRKQFSKAQSNFQESLALSQELGDELNIASALKALGVNAQAQSHLDDAVAYLSQALQRFTVLQDTQQAARVQRHLGDIAYQQKRYNQAVEHFLAALSVLQKSPFSKALMRTHRGLSNSYQALGDLAQALEHHQRFAELQYQLLTEQNKAETQRLQVQFETQRFAAENEQLTLLNQQQEAELAHRETILKMQYLLLALVVAILILVAILWSRSRRHAKVMQQLATRDELTGLQNRRSLMQFAKQEWHRATRFNRPYCCIAIDIDHFKTINDTWGHATGDQVLKQIAHTIQFSLRVTDSVGRIGGEEFLLISIESDIQQALTLAERIRQNVEAIEHPHQPDVPITISIGVAELNQQNSLDELMAQADEALYHSKNNGRNQVSRYPVSTT